MANINNTSSYMDEELFSLKPEGSKDSIKKCRLQTFKKNLKKWAMNKTSKLVSRI